MAATDMIEAFSSAGVEICFTNPGTSEMCAPPFLHLRHPPPLAPPAAMVAEGAGWPRLHLRPTPLAAQLLRVRDHAGTW